MAWRGIKKRERIDAELLDRCAQVQEFEKTVALWEELTTKLLSDSSLSGNPLISMAELAERLQIHNSEDFNDILPQIALEVAAAAGRPASGVDVIDQRFPMRDFTRQALYLQNTMEKDKKRKHQWYTASKRKLDQMQNKTAREKDIAQKVLDNAAASVAPVDPDEKAARLSKRNALRRMIHKVKKPKVQRATDDAYAEEAGGLGSCESTIEHIYMIH